MYANKEKPLAPDIYINVKSALGRSFYVQFDKIIENVRKTGIKYKAGELILFGSRATGCETEKSDIDLAVSGVREFEKLKEEIEEIPTLLSFDIINLDTCRNDLLIKEIRTYGRKIL